MPRNGAFAAPPGDPAVPPLRLNDEALSGSVVGVGLSGTFKLGVGVKHGWIPVGAPLKVTKSAGSVLHEIEGRPAISIYEDYFGEEEAQKLKEETLAKLAITYPLGMRIKDSEEMLIRDPLTVDEHGSITCAAEIPECQSDIFRIKRCRHAFVVRNLRG